MLFRSVPGVRHRPRRAHVAHGDGDGRVVAHALHLAGVGLGGEGVPVDEAHHPDGCAHGATVLAGGGERDVLGGVEVCLAKPTKDKNSVQMAATLIKMLSDFLDGLLVSYDFILYKT